MTDIIRVGVSGAAGRMGRAVITAVWEAEGLDLTAAVDAQHVGEDPGSLAGIGHTGLEIGNDLRAALRATKTDVLVDFSLPDAVMDNAVAALEMGVAPVIGTTGLSEGELAELDRLARSKDLGVFVAPNFAIGAVLMMQFAAQAARYLPDVEIIELHHERKLDSPSGTALLTAQKIAHARQEAQAQPLPHPANTVERSPGARGAHDHVTGHVPVHSVRLPGFVAHQEVIFGGLGQVLTLRHDSLDRTSFMPGVILAVRKIGGLRGLTVGLEKLLDL
jgi:4-hydroxy-tetrahydrodipicolinate reductase